MSQTDQGPLSLDWCESAQQELAKLAQMFDLGEHWLDDDVAALVYLIAPGSLQLSPHLVPNDGIGCRSAFHSRLIIRRHVQVNFFQLFVGQAGGAEVAGIGSRLCRQAPRFCFTPVKAGNNCSASFGACTTLAATI